ncbi:MAG: YciI family protein [Myxococcales bacterium]|nr:YciI family protein [Myxococcales bacterium]
MKFMVIVKASKDSEAGVQPSELMLSEMMKFNEELMKAGVLLDASGLQPSSKGVRVVFSGKERRVVDGPFTETKELIAGYWVLQCKSLAECVEWIKRCPNPYLEDGAVEIRPFYEMEDFGNANAETLERAARIDAAIKP